MSDRDEVVKYSYEKLPGGKAKVRITNKKGVLPPKEGYVRMPLVKGQWMLTPIDSGKTKVVMTSLFDPGGSIPAYLTRQSIVNSPMDIIEELRKEVE